MKNKYFFTLLPIVDLRIVLLVLALAVASTLALYAYRSSVLSSKPLPGYEAALAVRDALTAGRLSGLEVHVSQVPMLLNITVDGREYVVQASRVLVCFRARGAPVYEEPSARPWRSWGNGTHAGAVSWIGVRDDGSTVHVYFYSASITGKASSLCVSSQGNAVLTLASKQGCVSGYCWSGARSLIVLRRVVGSC
ncbi:hypothetical protein MA03_07270 [Infirmifilum uzonense]|uniref:Uncharacterized protein n=1 Tax=Infirmifilum uzonense TaxID=1550241 RepID=A0A0F7FIB0_9CREN|nr:hypothetical protein [Infirmifilum uzonense]AKG39080.1 hypothetical protein MA03_07270 [Infirmifilum uzonense]